MERNCPARQADEAVGPAPTGLTHWVLSHSISQGEHFQGLGGGAPRLDLATAASQTKRGTGPPNLEKQLLGSPLWISV